MPKFSIITTTYKHEKYIRETIESVLSQSFDSWELLIGDDSPGDATWSIIEEYVKKYPEKIRAWHHNPNRWIVENMNFLFSQVSSDSEYIAFLEGDDKYAPDCLEKKLQIFEKYPEVAIVYSDMDFINAEWEVTLHSLLASGGVHIYQDESILPDEYILSKNPLIVSYSSVAVRRVVLDIYTPIRNLTGSKIYAVSDYDLIFHIIWEYRVYGIEKSLTLYRRHANNLSASYGWLFDDLLILLWDYRDADKIDTVTYKKKIAWIHILSSIASLASWDKTSSWNHLKKSLQENPSGYILYKIVVSIALILPISWMQKILQKRIRRGA
jgi:teichuronic acid biosynthesis glycosyltransferase TuaG